MEVYLVVLDRVLRATPKKVVNFFEEKVHHQTKYLMIRVEEKSTGTNYF